MSTLIQLASKEFDGTDYVYVYADGDEFQNGDELKNAVAESEVNFNNTGRKQTVLMGPGKYNLNFEPVQINADIDIVGISSNPEDVNIYPGNLAFGSFGTYANFYSLNAGTFGNDLQDLYVYYLNQGYTSDVQDASYIDNNGDTIIFLAKQYSMVRINTKTLQVDVFNHTSTMSNIFVDKKNRNVFYFEFSGSWLLRKVNSTFTGNDLTFISPTFNSPNIFSIKSDTAGNLYAAGFFNTVNAAPRQYFVKLFANGLLDGTFNIGTSFNSSVRDFVIDEANGQVIVVGFFSSYNGNPAQYVARLNQTTAAYSALPGQTGAFNSIVLTVDIAPNAGYLLFTGYFNSYNGSFNIYNVRTDLFGGSNTQLIDNTQPFNNQNAYFDDYNERLFLYPTTGGNVINGTSFELGNSVLNVKLSNGTTSVIAVPTPGTQNTGSAGSLLYFQNSDGEEYILYPKYFSNYNSFAVFENFGYVPTAVANVIANMTTRGAIVVANTQPDLILRNVKAFYVSTYNDFYNPFIATSYYSLIIEDSEILEFTYSKGNLRVDNSLINFYIPNNNFATNNFGSSVNIYLNKSRLNNFYSSQQGITFYIYEIKDCQIDYSFNYLNNGTYDPSIGFYSSSIVITVNIIDSNINQSFYESLVCTTNIRSSILQNGCFYYDNNGTNYDVRFNNYSLIVNDCSLIDSGSSFIFNNYSNGSWTASKSNAYYGVNVSLNRVNASGNGGIFVVRASSTYQNIFKATDVTLTDFSQALYYENVFLDANEFTTYDYNPIITFENCTLRHSYSNTYGAICYIMNPSFCNDNYSNAITINNITFNDCSVITSYENTEVQSHTITIGVTGNIANILILNRINFTNCTINTYSFQDCKSFLSYIAANTISLNDINFTNCNINALRLDSTEASFLHRLIGANSINFNSIAFNNCRTPSGFLSLIDTINTGDNPSISFINCNAYSNKVASFFSTIVNISFGALGSLYFENCSITGKSGNRGFIHGNDFSTFTDVMTITFVQCTSVVTDCFYRGFTQNYDVYIYASFCKSSSDSFGDYNGGVLTYNGEINNCDINDGSFGTYGGVVNCTSQLTINQSNTHGSVTNLTNYTNNYSI